jgi:hypothetical protein
VTLEKLSELALGKHGKEVLSRFFRSSELDSAKFSVRSGALVGLAEVG